MSITLSDGIYASSGLTVSPELLSGSMEFNGTDQYLTTPGNAAFTLTSDFTIECWFYDTDIAATEALFGKRPDSITYGGVGLGHAGNSNLDFLGTITGSNWEIQLNSTIATPANQWHHVAITRLGNVYTMWVNGQSASTQTEAGALLANPAVPFTIGATAQDGTSPWSGYISNLRIVNGIAVYTSAFTPSSSPLTVVQPQNFNGSPSSFIYSGATVLLLNTTNNDFNFLDISDNHFILTGPNMPTPSVLTPFFGSLLFNGTSDFLTIPSGVPTTSATWTIEFWIYTTDNSTQQSFVSTTPGGLNFWKYPGTGQLILDDGQYGQPPIDAYISVNTWTHLAIVRNGDIGATAVYKDGILVGSSVGPYGPLNSTLYIGNYAGSQFYYTGYMSNFRYVSGVAVYTNNFITSTNQLTSVQGANVNGSPSSAISGSQTKLLLNTQYNNGTYLLDSSSNHYNVLGPNMPVPSAANPFDPTGSLSFNGSSNVVYVESNTAFEFGTGDFTVEGWYYFNSIGPDLGLVLVGNGADVGVPAYSAWWMRYYSGAGGPYLSWFRTDLVTEDSYIFPTTLNTGQWYHIACTRSGTDLRFFVDGTQIGAAQTCVTNYSLINSDPLQTGRAWTGNGLTYLDGYASNIRVVKGIAVYTSDFVPSSNPLTSTQLANVNGSPSAAILGTETSLLLNTINNTTYLLDSSSYQFDVLGPNMPVPDANTPLTGGASSLYNGTNASLLINGSGGDALDLATGQPNWTIETWFYVNSLAASTALFLQGGYVGVANSSYFVFIDTDGTVYWIVGDGGDGGAFQSAGVVGIDTWYHFALVRDGNNLTSYLDGVETATVSMTFNMGYTGTQLTIGSDLGAYGAGGAYFNGYISNFRIVKGIAVYTEEFTPSTNILTATQLADVNGSPSAAISGTETSLLLTTPNNNYNLIDTSSYDWIVSSPGTPSSSIVAPNFLIDGSMLFNGSSDYLTVVDSGASPEFTFGAGDWTIECWIYPTSGGLDQGIISKLYNIGTEAGPFTILLNSSNIPVLYSCSNGGGSGWNITALGTTPVSLNSWSHIAFTRNGNVFTTWVNGVLSANVTISFTLYDNSLESVVIGSADMLGNPSYLFHGNISNVRIVKGVAVYTSDFTPSTTPLTATQTANVNGNPSAAITGTETSLLLNTFNSSNNRLDSSSYNFLVTSPNTPVPDDLNPLLISEGSMLFNGTSQYIVTPVSSTLTPTASTTPMTIEAWIYPQSYTNGFIVCNTFSGGTIPYALYLGGGVTPGTPGDKVVFATYNGAGNWNGCVTTANVTISAWTHVAAVFDGTNMSIYINGVQSATVVQTLNTGGTNQVQIGKRWDYAEYFNGYISNIRIVNGIAVYTTDFTPPTSNLTATQVANQNGLPSAAIFGTETSLLLNTPNNVLNIFDSSSYRLQVTSPGNPTPVINNPF